MAVAFRDIIGIEEEDILRVMSGFGYGMGGERSVCGALTGGIFVVSSMSEDPAMREETYDRVYYLINRFKELNNGNLNCIDLVGETPTEKEFQGMCPVFIETVVRELANLVVKRS